MQYTPHPVADLFPLIEGDDYAALKADIATYGQREPIWLLDDQILDGRNRYRACCDLKMTPRFQAYDGPTDMPGLVAFVISLNLRRRHLSATQKAVLGLEIEKVLAEAAHERMIAGKTVDPVANLPQGQPGRAREQAAAIVGAGARYVSDAKRVAKRAPDLLPKMRSGEVSMTDAKRQMKARDREAARAANRSLIDATPAPVVDAPAQRYPTIVLDPPWDWGDEGDADQFGRARPTYGTMTFNEIADLPVDDLAADDAHLYLWITNRSLPKGFRLLDEWGFRYVTMLTWGKPHFGMGNYFRGQTEHVLFGVRGSLALLRRDVGTLLLAKRGERHSSKPGEFYDLVETCSPGPWLELFARAERPGWAVWGAEVRDAAA